MTAIDTMGAWGIVSPADVAEISARTGLPLALACALLDQESSGGHNVWGSDGGAGVQTGGAYIPGRLVTESAYRAYRRLADASVIIRQGCGPCQLTARAWQDAADARGGCWNPAANMLAGFSGLVTMINQYGLPDGVRRYNGSGAAAEAYRDRVLARYRSWTDRLGVNATPGDDDMQPDERAALMEVRDGLRAAGIGKGRLPGRSAGTVAVNDDPYGWILTAAGRADDANAGVQALRAQVNQLAAQIPQLPADWPALLAQALIAHVTGGTQQ
jgi:hypothetical protein